MDKNVQSLEIISVRGEYIKRRPEKRKIGSKKINISGDKRGEIRRIELRACLHIHDGVNDARES